MACEYGPIAPGASFVAMTYVAITRFLPLQTTARLPAGCTAPIYHRNGARSTRHSGLSGQPLGYTVQISSGPLRVRPRADTPTTGNGDELDFHTWRHLGRAVDPARAA